MHTRQGAAVPAQPKNTPLTYLAEQLAAALGPRPTPPLKQQKFHHYPSCALVPREVWAALDCACPDVQVTRAQLAERISPLMAIGDWRFCACYRHGATAEHRFISRLIDTVAANAAADVRERSYQGIVFIKGSEL
jgi:hypothetical protein